MPHGNPLGIGGVDPSGKFPFITKRGTNFLDLTQAQQDIVEADVKQVRSKRGGGIGGFLKKIGKVVGKAAPLAAFIPGVGLPLAAGLGAVGGLAGGGGVKGAAQGAALGLTTEGLQKGIQALRNKGFNEAANQVAQAAQANPAAANDPNFLQSVIGSLGGAKGVADIFFKGAGIVGGELERRGEQKFTQGKLDLLTGELDEAKARRAEFDPIRKQALGNISTALSQQPKGIFQTSAERGQLPGFLGTPGQPGPPPVPEGPGVPAGPGVPPVPPPIPTIAPDKPPLPDVINAKVPNLDKIVEAIKPKGRKALQKIGQQAGGGLAGIIAKARQQRLV